MNGGRGRGRGWWLICIRQVFICLCRQGPNNGGDLNEPLTSVPSANRQQILCIPGIPGIPGILAISKSGFKNTDNMLTRGDRIPRKMLLKAYKRFSASPESLESMML